MTQPIIEARNITVRFGGLTAIDNVSMSVREGCIHGLIGPNGAGKTTFFNVVTGLVRQAEGQILLGGRDISGLAAHQRVETGLRRSFQSVQLVPGMSAMENILIGLHSSFARQGWKSVLDLFIDRGAEARAQEKVEEIADFLGLSDVLATPANALTFAQQRMVEIARALASDPRVLMLDEPAAGLSEGEIRQLDVLLRRLVEERGMSVVLVEHVLSLVLGVSDEITVLENGRLIATGSPEEVAANPRVRAAYLGEEADA